MLLPLCHRAFAFGDAGPTPMATISTEDCHLLRLTCKPLSHLKASACIHSPSPSVFAEAQRSLGIRAPSWCFLPPGWKEGALGVE